MFCWPWVSCTRISGNILFIRRVQLSRILTPHPVESFCSTKLVHSRIWRAYMSHFPPNKVNPSSSNELLSYFSISSPQHALLLILLYNPLVHPKRSALMVRLLLVRKINVIQHMLLFLFKFCGGFLFSGRGTEELLRPILQSWLWKCHCKTQYMMCGLFWLTVF